MEGITQTLNLDMMGASPNKMVLTAKQCDTNSRHVRLVLVARGKPYKMSSDCKTYLYIQKPDKKKVFIECQKDGENAVIVTLAEQALAAAGVATCELYIQGEDGDIKSQSFYLHIEPAVMDTDAIESSDEFSGLAATLAEIQAVKQELDAGMVLLIEAANDAKQATEAAREQIELLNQSLEEYGGPEADPTVPEWAKQAEKPAYTAQEVGAVPVGGDISGNIVDSLDSINTMFPVPVAGEKVKTFLGKVEKNITDTNVWRSETEASLTATKSTLTNTQASLENTQDSLMVMEEALAVTQESLATTRESIIETQETLTETRGSLTETIGSLTETKESLVDTRESLTATQAAITVTEEATNDRIELLEQRIDELSVEEISPKWANVIIGTASGKGRVTMPDAWAAKVQDLKLRGKSEQVTISGSQLCEIRPKVFTLNGITFTMEEEGGWIHVQGTIATSGATTTCRIDQRTAGSTDNLKDYNGTYTLSMADKVNPSDKVRVIMMTYPAYYTHMSTNSSVTKTVDASGAFLYISISNPVAGEVYDTRFKVMLNPGSAALPYEPYTGGIPAPNPGYPQEINSVVDPVIVTQSDTIILDGITLRSIGNVRDTLTRRDGVWGIEVCIGSIDSYSDETVAGEYMSTTGGLDPGATIIYVLAEPAWNPLPDAIQQQLNSLQTGGGDNTIYTVSDVAPDIEVVYVQDSNKVINNLRLEMAEQETEFLAAIGQLKIDNNLI